MSVLYKRIFAYGSLQFCGHIEEYLAAHTEELLIFIVQPRVGSSNNLIRRYRNGSRVDERPVRSSQNLILYYAFWYAHHVSHLLRFCPRREKTVVLGGHPLAFLGMSWLKLLRPLTYAYWIGDYFPSSHPVIRLFERVKKGYHDRVDYTYYLTDAINRVMNGGAVVDTPNHRTVMWGLAPFPAVTPPPLEPFTLLFVGLVRPGQGLEALFTFLSVRRSYRLKIIGVCQPDYYVRLQALVASLGLDGQVFFPNRFYSEPELVEVAATCHVGLALYDTSGDNFTHYADPGKVKAYAEMRLPVLMTRISDIVPYVERFCSGEVISGIGELGQAIERIRDDYPRYQAGIMRFNGHFEYDAYYREAFRALEEA
jgi:glycosyltransferase involved in cell wall biosynthesis